MKSLRLFCFALFIFLSSVLQAQDTLYFNYDLDNLPNNFFHFSTDYPHFKDSLKNESGYLVTFQDTCVCDTIYKKLNELDLKRALQLKGSNLIYKFFIYGVYTKKVEPYPYYQFDPQMESPHLFGFSHQGILYKEYTAKQLKILDYTIPYCKQKKPFISYKKVKQAPKHFKKNEAFYPYHFNLNHAKPINFFFSWNNGLPTSYIRYQLKQLGYPVLTKKKDSFIQNPMTYLDDFKAKNKIDQDTFNHQTLKALQLHFSKEALDSTEQAIVFNWLSGNSFYIKSEERLNPIDSSGYIVFIKNKKAKYKTILKKLSPEEIQDSEALYLQNKPIQFVFKELEYEIVKRKDSSCLEKGNYILTFIEHPTVYKTYEWKELKANHFTIPTRKRINDYPLIMVKKVNNRPKNQTENSHFTYQFPIFDLVKCSRSRPDDYTIHSIEIALNKNGYAVLVNNILDFEDKSALMDFQKKNGLAVGVLDTETLRTLGILY